MHLKVTSCGSFLPVPELFWLVSQNSVVFFQSFTLSTGTCLVLSCSATDEMKIAMKDWNGDLKNRLERALLSKGTVQQ